MKRVISVRADSKGNIYLEALIAPGTPRVRYTERKITPFKAGGLQRAIGRFHQEDRATIRPWGGHFVGWVAEIF